MFFPYPSLNPSSPKTAFFHSSRLSFRKQIPHYYFLFLLLLFLKYMPPLLLTSSLTNLNTSSFSFWKLLNYLTFFQSNKPIITFPYYLTCIFIYILFMFFILINIYLHIQLNILSTHSEHRNEISKVKLPFTYKRLQRICISLYFIIIICSQHISEILIYAIFDVCGIFNKSKDVNVDHNKRETIAMYFKYNDNKKYIILVLNILSLLYMMYVFVSFFDLFCKQHFKESYGYGMYFTFFSKMYMLIMSNLQGFYTVSFIYKEHYQKQILFYISLIVLSMDIGFIVNVILLKKTFLEWVEFFNFVFVNISCVSALFDISSYLLIKYKHTLHLVNALPRIVMSLFNGILIAKGIKYLNEKHLQQVIQKYFFTFYQDNFSTDFNTFIRAFLYLSRLLYETSYTHKDIHHTLRKIFREHLLSCENNTCICKTLQQYSDKSIMKGYNVIFNNVLHALLRFLKKTQFMKKRYFQLLYINEVNYQHLVLNNNIKALYLSQLYLDARNVVSDPYQFYEIRKVINKKYKLKNINEKDDNKRTYIKDTIKNIQDIFNEETTNEIIQNLMYDICSGIEELYKIKSQIIINNKVEYTLNDILKILDKILLTKTILMKSINSYLMTKHSHINELQYLLNHFISIIPLYKKELRLLSNNNPIIMNSQFLSNELEHKEKDSYLILYVNSRNDIIIKSMSLKLLDMLKYTKREIYDMEFSKLLPSFIGELHNRAMIKKIISVCIPYELISKYTFLLNKARELLRVYHSFTIFPSFDKAIYVINKISKIDLIDNEGIFQYYYMLTDDNYNIITMSPEFIKDFCINQKMLKRYQINLPHFFNLNHDKLFKYFNSRTDNIKQIIIDDSNTINSLCSIDSQKDNVDPNSNTFISMYEVVHKDIIALSLKKIIKKHQENGVSQDKQKSIQNVILLLMQTTTLPFGATPSSLFIRTPMARKISKESDNNANINTNDYFFLKIQRKSLENQIYYIVRIKINRKILEYKNKYINNNNQFQFGSISKISSLKNTASHIGGNSSSKGVVIKKQKGNCDEKGTPRSHNMKYAKGIGMNTLSNKDLHTMNSNAGILHQGTLHIINDIQEETEENNNNQHKISDVNAIKSTVNLVNDNNNGIIANKPQPKILSKFSSKKQTFSKTPTFTSKVQSIVSTKKYIPKPETSQNNNNNITNTDNNINSAFINIKILNIQYKKHKKQNSIIKITQFILYIILAIFCIINFVTNKCNLDKSLTIFHLNSDSFMVSLDIFYSSLICLRGCLINDNLHSSSFSEYLIIKEESQNQLIEHFHKFLQHINFLIKENNGHELISVLNKEVDYYHLMADWEEKKVKSYFLEEIRQIYYYVSHFKLTKHRNVCRIQRIFLNQGISNSKVKDLPSPSCEEKFVYYICRNIMNQLSSHLRRLTMETSKLVKQISSQSQMDSLSINAAIVAVALLVFYTVMLILRYENKFLYNYVITVFQQRNDENVFINKLIRLKYLIYNFSYEECMNYEIGLLNTVNKRSSDKSNERVLPIKETPNKRKTYKHSYENGSVKTMSSSDITNNSMSSLLHSVKGNSNDNDINNNYGLYVNVNKLIKKFPEPTLTKNVKLILVILIALFIILQIVKFSYSIYFFNNLFLRNEISISFYNQIPKLSEFFLYAIISIIIGSPFYITKHEIDYTEIKTHNILQTEFNYTQDSLYNLLGNSNYYYLYYQLSLHRLNIQYFLNENSVNRLFKLTGIMETKYLETNKDFCIYLQLGYSTYSYNHTVHINHDGTRDHNEVVDIIDLFRRVSEFTKLCQSVNNGINKSGVKKAIDVHLNQLNKLYLEFFTAENKKEKIVEILDDENINGLFDNLFFVLKKFHFVTNDVINIDITNELRAKYELDIFLSVASIVFSFGIIFLIVFVIARKIEKFTNNTMLAANFMDYVLNHFN